MDSFELEERKHKNFHINNLSFLPYHMLSLQGCPCVCIHTQVKECIYPMHSS